MADVERAELRVPDRWAARRLLGGAAAAGLVALLTFLVVLPDGAAPTALDEWVHQVTTDWTAHAPWAVDLAALIGRITDVVPASVLAGVVTVNLAVRRQWTLALFLVLSAVVATVIVEMLKRRVGRIRPESAEEFGATMDRSFPSGHAASGVYIFGAIAILVVLFALRDGNSRRYWAGRALFVFGIVIGCSRIVLGVHWTTDVLAGWALASLVVLLAAVLLRPDDVILGSARTATDASDRAPSEGEESPLGPSPTKPGDAG